MANFQTHFYVATTVTGGTAAGLFAGGIGNEHDAARWLLLGAIGGLLPDIDADNSRPVRIGFTVLAIVLAFQAMLMLSSHVPAWQYALVWIGVFLAVRFGLFEAFTRWTRHRGVIHSIPMGLVLALVVVVAADQWEYRTETMAWLDGGFLLFGFLIHLVLDELYAVDLTGAKLKQSFGSALKLGSWRAPMMTFALYVAIGWLYWHAPPLDGLAVTLERFLGAGY